jgi:hypothetical protein
MDILNESYICFRRREIKAVCKTRESRVTFSGKIFRLQNELSQSLALAEAVVLQKLDCVGALIYSEVSIHPKERRGTYIAANRAGYTVTEREGRTRST